MWLVWLSGYPWLQFDAKSLRSPPFVSQKKGATILCRPLLVWLLGTRDLGVRLFPQFILIWAFFRIHLKYGKFKHCLLLVVRPMEFGDPSLETVVILRLWDTQLCGVIHQCVRITWSLSVVSRMGRVAILLRWGSSMISLPYVIPAVRATHFEKW